MRFIKGTMLTSVPARKITPRFLTLLEETIRRMHAAGVAHLDIRSMSNIIMRPDGSPAIIDFQSAVRLRGLPACLRKLFMDIDMSGAYKKWKKFCPEQMGEFRESELERINAIRRFWVFRGYFGMKKTRRTSSSGSR